MNLGADTSFCGGGSVVLDAGAGNAAYLWSTGATTQTITSTPGVIWASATDVFGCSDADSILISQYPSPTVQLGADTLICGPGPLILNAGNQGSNFIWNTGGSAQLETVTTSGTFDVQVTDSNGCAATDTIAVTISDPTIDLGPDTTLCNAAATVLTVGGGWASVLWSNGSTNDFININASNTYSVVVVDSAGCTDSDSILVTASSNPIASFSAVGNSGCTQATVSNFSLQGTSFLWRWGDGTTSTGANPAPHTYGAPFSGNITLVVTNPCGMDSLVTPFGCVGTSNADLIKIGISPNPSHGQVRLSVSGLNATEMTLSVLNLQGQQVYEIHHALSGNGFAGNLELGHLAKGVYFLRIATADGQYTRKLVIE